MTNSKHNVRKHRNFDHYEQYQENPYYKGFCSPQFGNKVGYPFQKQGEYVNLTHGGFLVEGNCYKNSVNTHKSPYNRLLPLYHPWSLPTKDDIIPYVWHKKHLGS